MSIIIKNRKSGPGVKLNRKTLLEAFKGPDWEITKSKPVFLFRQNTDGVWEIRFHKNKLYIPDSSGFKTIQFLLIQTSQDRQFQSKDLDVIERQMLPNESGGYSFDENRPNKKGLKANVGGEILSQETRRSYQAEITRLKKIELDDPQYSKAQSDIKILKQQLLEAVGLGGKPRQMSKDAKKIDDRVKKRIKDALEKIRRKNNDLYIFLKQNIKFKPAMYYCGDLKWRT